MDKIAFLLSTGYSVKKIVNGNLQQVKGTFQCGDTTTLWVFLGQSPQEKKRKFNIDFKKNKLIISQH